MNQSGNPIKYIYLLLFFFLLTPIFAQNIEEKRQLEELAGYKYLTSIVNENPAKTDIPIVIGLHWSGSTPNEFAAYLNEFTIPVRLILVQAPYPHKSGYSFFERQPQDYYKLPADEKMAVLLKEADKLSRFIEAVTIRYKPAKKPVIIGASQGGDLSYVVGIRYNHLISQSCPLLATMDNRIIIPAKSQKTLARIDSFHGTADPIVNINDARGHIKLLKENGYQAKLYTYESIKHDIPDSMKKDYTNLIEKVLSK